MNGSVLVGLSYMPGVPMGNQVHFDEFDNRSFFNHTFFSYAENWRNYTMNGSVLVGLSYMPGVPMGNQVHFDEFDNRSFFNHTFFSLSGGMSTLNASGIKQTLKGFGPQFSLGVGKWLAPSSALRLSATMGYADALSGSVNRHFKHVDLHADYLFHLNNILWGYDEDRLFSLIGVAGVNLGIAQGNVHSVQVAPGVGVGLQGSFRLNRSVDLFVEPRLNYYHKKYAGGHGFGKGDQLGELNVGLTYLQGSFRLNRSVDLFVEPRLNYYHKKYAGGHGFGKGDQLGELNVGLTYHAVDRADHPNYAFTKKHIADNLFMTSGIGLQLFLNKVNMDHLCSLGPQASVSVGKWLTPSSGLRLVASGGFFSNYAVPYNTPEGRLRHVSVSGGLDYLWNITSTMSGYNPDRTFELISSIGVNLAYTSATDHHFQPGINGGVQGLWHVNDFLGLYIEPQVRLYGDKFIEGNLGFMKKDVLVGINAGFHYRFVPYSKATNRKTFAEDEKRYFVSGALGVGSLLVANRDLIKNAGVEAKGSFGKWYTPLSAWRLSGTILYKSKAPNKLPLHYAGLSFDYMMSLSTLAKGYHSDPVIDVLPFAGIHAGLARRNGQFKVVPGFDAGIQFKLKLASSLHFFLEPQLGIRSDAYNGISEGRPDRVASMVGGLIYKFKMPTFQ